MAKEKKLEPSLVHSIEIDNFGLCIKLLPFLFTGLPDRLSLLPGGRLFFVETKTTGKGLRERQKVVHKLLKNLGFDVWVLDDWPILEQIKIKYNLI